MISLIITACSLLSGGGKCHDVSLNYSDVSLVTCMIMGQSEVAQWGMQHPNWSISKFRCETAGEYAKL